MKVRKLVAVLASAAVASAMAVSASAYTAGLDFKASNWAHRNNLNQSNAMYCILDETEEEEMLVIPGWQANDVTFDKDGTYTCSFKFDAMEDAKDGVDSFWYVLKLETSIPDPEDESISITIDKLTVDGKEVPAAKNAAMFSQKGERSDGYDDKEVIDFTTNYLTFEFYNNWNPDSKYISSSDDYGREVEVTFTVSGLGSEDEPSTGGDAAGDTNKPSDDKNSPDTGVEGVAVVAGLAVIAAGAVVVAKKRK